MAVKISAQDVAKHSPPKDLWTIVNGDVYDLTSFLPSHTGGEAVLLQYAGRDATAAYSKIHAPALIKTSLPLSAHLGPLDQAKQTPDPPPQSQSQPSMAKPALGTLISTYDFVSAAQASFPAKTWPSSHPRQQTASLTHATRPHTHS